MTRGDRTDAVDGAAVCVSGGMLSSVRKVTNVAHRAITAPEGKSGAVCLPAVIGGPTAESLPAVNWGI